MQQVSTQWLKSLEVFNEVPEGQLKWLIEHSKQNVLKQDEYLFKPEQPIHAMHIVVSGKLSLFINQNGSKIVFDEMLPGHITGLLPFSRAKVTKGFSQCLEECHVLSLSDEHMRDLIINNYELSQALVHVMTNRVRDFTALQQQNEKMMALGKLSAGLAHELNNPAAAIVRSSSSLLKHLQLQPETFKKVSGIRMPAQNIDGVNNKLFEIINRKEITVLSLSDRSKKEDELLTWLDTREISDAYELSENFADAGIDIKDLEDFSGFIPSEHLDPVLAWINSNIITNKMVNDIKEASQRIDELVKSVKHFTHMDAGGRNMQFADIHDGIKNTLNMLNYKLKNSNIKVVHNFDTTLPPVKAMIGELNQVWTNIIDNASDAMEGTKNGILTINTERDHEFVKVTIRDNGPGITEEIKSRIFDPFFTTKSIGKGTGLGLDVVMRIVKQHHGSVKVTSKPGETAFVVCFPINGITVKK